MNSVCKWFFVVSLTMPGLVYAQGDIPLAVKPLHDGPFLQVVSEPEVVFNWSQDYCYPQNVPDLPVRAYRDANGVTLLLSHTKVHAMRGVDFSDLSLDCDPVMTSSLITDVAAHAHNEWLAAVYAEEDGTIHGLIHNEFHGHEADYDQCRTNEYFRCWYNTITYRRSENGAMFERMHEIPDHLVASVSDRYIPDEGIFGAFSPSNIIRREDHYYAFLKVQPYPFGFQHVCLMRSDDLSDPKSWRFWDGFAFEGRFADPYTADDRALAMADCPAVAINEIAQMYEGVTWNTHLQKYVLIGTSNDPALGDENVHGFYYALSDDLIHWEHRRPLLEVRLPWNTANPNEPVFMYPTLIDHDSPSRNFETTGQSAWLYFTRLNNGQSGLDRDLVRVRVAFTK